MRKIMGIVAGLLFVTLIPASGVAHEAGFGSGVKVTSAQNVKGTGEYRGRVTSKKKKCKKKRRVEVYHHVIGGPDFKIGSTQTNATGRFVVRGNMPPQGDHVYAKVLKKVLKSPGHRHRCKPAKSPFFTFPGGPPP